MLEECFCCGAHAPSWEEEDYGEWTLELDAGGAYLGVICPGCFAGEGLAFLGAEPASAVEAGLRLVAATGPDAPYAAAA